MHHFGRPPPPPPPPPLLRAPPHALPRGASPRTPPTFSVRSAEQSTDDAVVHAQALNKKDTAMDGLDSLVFLRSQGRSASADSITSPSPGVMSRPFSVLPTPGMSLRELVPRRPAAAVWSTAEEFGAQYDVGDAIGGQQVHPPALSDSEHTHPPPPARARARALTSTCRRRHTQLRAQRRGARHRAAGCAEGHFRGAVRRSALVGLRMTLRF